MHTDPAPQDHGPRAHDSEPFAFERLAELMEALADGHEAAAVTILVEFGPQLRATARRHLEALGLRQGVTQAAAEVACDIALEVLPAVARAWDPRHRARPWGGYATWRVRAVAARFVGQWSDSIDAPDGPQLSDVVDVGVHPRAQVASDLEVARSLGDHDGRFRRLVQVLDQVIRNPRDRALWITYRIQLDQGDPSPSHTVARIHGMRPDAVRQAYRRTDRRLARAFSSDPSLVALGVVGFAA